MTEKAGDFELGDDVTDQFTVRKPVGVVVSTRLERELADAFLNRCLQEGKKTAQVMREAIIAYLEHDHRPNSSALPGGGYLTASGVESVAFHSRVPVAAVTHGFRGEVRETGRTVAPR
jgi:hypothetical protein